ncbi:MAG: hypothetical protein Q4D51_00355 [Eubacteriales bacterium]|nr:hypothetical protein [Eubacteriales bacterium]
MHKTIKEIWIQEYELAYLEGYRDSTRHHIQQMLDHSIDATIISQILEVPLADIYEIQKL